MLKTIKEFLFGTSCVVYVGCKMSGRDRAEMVKRATFVCEVLRAYGLTPISPVVEESVPTVPGKLINHDAEKVKGFWKRDKHIIRRMSRVVLVDHGEMKSFGFEREYCLNRGVLWKPTVLFVPQGTPVSVALYEDDLIGHSIHTLAAEIKKRWGSRYSYWKWRMQMLNRALPGWFVDQLWAWR